VSSVMGEAVLLEMRDFTSISLDDVGGRDTVHVMFMAVFVTVKSVEAEGGSADANVHSSSTGADC
jgi:hypothetical protein